METIEEICKAKGIKLTKNRRIIAEIILNSKDHPDVNTVYQRSIKINPDIGIATVYRAISFLEEMGIIVRHNFKDARACYEQLDTDGRHYHIINVKNEEVIEVFDKNLDEMIQKLAKQKGYDLVDYKLELYCSNKL